MALIRILEKGAEFRRVSDEAPSEQSICGSAVKHFKVSETGKLSFYQDNTLSVQKIAFGFALGRREVDEVEYCLLPREEVEAITALVPTPGATPLADVNQEHLDAVGVTLDRLCKLVVVGASSTDFGSMTSAEIVEEFVSQTTAGHLSETAVAEKLLEKIKQTNAYKRAMRRVAQQAAAR